MTRSLRRAALILLCMALGACASPFPDHDAGADGPRRGPPRKLPNVFISPAGEPFRAEVGAPYPVSAWFMQADANHDGRIDRAEFRADALRFFDRLDANHDGVLDGLEVQDYEQTVAPEILPKIEDLHAYEGMDMSLNFDDPNNTENRRRTDTRGGRTGDRPGQSNPLQARGTGIQGAAVYSLINMPEPVAGADAKFDGRITRAEFQDAADHRFDLLDKTGSGYLTLAKLPKTPLQAAILKQQKDEKKRSGRPPAP